MTGALTHYDAALNALDAAIRLDDVVAVRDVSEHLKLQARLSKDPALLQKAIELRLRSERRLGQMLSAAKEDGQLNAGGRPTKTSAQIAGVSRLTLSEAGITHRLSADAQKLAAIPSSGFENLIAEQMQKVAAGRAAVINPHKDLSTREKQLKRNAREIRLAAKQKALPDLRFGVIYADPEWEFKTRSEAGMSRSAENHYPTSSVDVIQSRPVSRVAAPDCVLFLWVTVPHLPSGLAVMGAWGFKYVSSFAWDKVEQATGYWNRGRHEILLIGTRGNPPAPAPGTQFASLMTERRREHSRKPDWAYEMIEAYYPTLRKIELNARIRRSGWHAWVSRLRTKTNSPQWKRRHCLQRLPGAAVKPRRHDRPAQTPARSSAVHANATRGLPDLPAHAWPRDVPLRRCRGTALQGRGGDRRNHRLRHPYRRPRARPRGKTGQT